MNDDLLKALLESKKYRDVCPDTVKRLWSECLPKYKKPKDVDKAVRTALHGITGAFLTEREAAECAEALRRFSMDPSDIWLEVALGKHASTRERLPLSDMDALYARILAPYGRDARVLDLACGINPLYLGARGIKATGVDISGRAVDLINGFDAPVDAVCGDLLCEGALPRERFDVALLFKVLPLLERQRPGAAIDVMRTIDAGVIVASFPTRTLGGRNVGMSAHYSEWMESHLPEDRIVSDRFEFGCELFYLLKEK